MPDPKTVVTVVKSLYSRYGVPVPLSMGEATAWSEGLDLPREGDYLLVTGYMYQLVPYIDSLVEVLEKRIGSLAARIAVIAARVVDVSKFIRPRRELQEYVRRVLQSIVKILLQTGYSIGYDPSIDMYSGALLYDLGLDELFKSHLEAWAKRIAERNVKRVVVVDPHTAYVLKIVAKKYGLDLGLEIKHYVELLAEKASVLKSRAKNSTKEKLAVHDPCLLARGLGVYKEVRQLLEAVGYRVVEPRRTGRLTFCCGGPIEALSPRLAKAVAEERIRELVETGGNIVTVCPICFINLKRALSSLNISVRIDDFAVYLADALKIS